MAKVITITDIRINTIRFSRDDSNNITAETDYYYQDIDGIIEGINLQVDIQTAVPIGSFPADVQAAMVTLNNYYETRIKTNEGI